MRVSRIVPVVLALVAAVALGAASNRTVPAEPDESSSVITV